jgi:phosphate-selective porin OprO and OprP
MRLNKKIIPALLATTFVSASFSLPAFANDSKELEDLRALVQELEQKIKVIDRKSELAEEAAATKKKETPIVQTEDGFGFKSADGKNEIKLQGRVEADYHAFGKNDAQNADTFDIRRTYLTLAGKVYNDYDFKVTGTFGDQLADATGTKTTKTILDEAYFGINWWKPAKFRFGQFQMPFGLETSTSDLFNDFAERSMANALTAFKERGALVNGNPIEGVYYGLALSTGRGKNADNTDNLNDSPEVVGRGAVNLAKFFNLNDSVVHVGGSFSHAYISNNQATNSNTNSANSFLVGYGTASPKTEGNGLTFFTPQGITLATGTDIERTRLAAETALTNGPVKLQGEYIYVNYSGNGKVNNTDGTVGTSNINFDSDIKAWYVSANWLVTGESYSDSYNADNGIWGRIKPRNNVDFANGKFGAIVLGLRFSDYDASDFGANTVGGVGYAYYKDSTHHSSFTSPTGAHAWTCGVTWILNPNTRLAINYVDTTFKGGEIKFTDASGATKYTDGEKAITLRGQFDF